MKLSGKEILNKIRLQVFLSHAGVCSRRKAMDWIKAGRVKVNGRLECEPSTLIDARSDKIEVDNRLVEDKAFTYLLLHKPAGYVTTKADRFAGKTVLDLVPLKFQHLVPAGRLDKDTEGLLLLTNDGDVVYALTHPRHNVDKTYDVRILGRLDESTKDRLERGIVLDGKKTAPAKISGVKFLDRGSAFSMTIHEGRKRQIRLMLAQTGHDVIYLKRISQGPLHLGDLKVGQWRHLDENEVRELKKI